MTRFTDSLSVLLAYTLPQRSGEKDINFHDLNWERLLVRAAQNKVLYLLVQELAKDEIGLAPRLNVYLDALLRDGERLFDQLVATLAFVKETFDSDGIPFLISKTAKGYRTLPSDVDLIIKPSDLSKVVAMLEGVGFQTIRHADYPLADNPNQRWCVKEGLLKLDIHCELSWQDLVCVDQQLIWRDPREVDVHGVRCPVPSREIELLSIAGNSMLEGLRSLTLLDLLFVNDLIQPDLDWDLIIEQVEKHNWSVEFLQFMSVVDELLHRLCLGQTHEDGENPDGGAWKVVGSCCSFPRQRVPVSCPLDMPYWMPYSWVLGTFTRCAKKSPFVASVAFAYYNFATFRYHLTHETVTGQYCWAGWDRLSRVPGQSDMPC